jgi:3-phenylpropionate/cinnamic acid dioxygenase small subunit
MGATESELAAALERKEVEDLVVRLGRMIDDQDWQGLTALFDDSVRVDYTSLFGGEAADTTPAELLAGWRSDLTALDSAQHVIIGPLAEVSGDRATASANIMILAKRSDTFGAATWSCAGRYELTLVRRDSWRITSFTLRAMWTDGNINVLMRAVTK